MGVLRILAVLAVMGALLYSLPILIGTRPLQTEVAGLAATYPAARFLSEPAQAGGAAFGDRCSECHGASGEGSGSAPAVTTLRYAGDFRNRLAFHSAVTRDVEAHRWVLRSSSGDGPGFNQVELMAKFLREMRQHNERKD